jgi:hypothetical protein
MQGFPDRLVDWEALFQVLSGPDRFRAAQRGIPIDIPMGWLWTIIAAVLLALIAVGLVIALIHKTKQLRETRVKESFEAHAKRVGLTVEEQSFLGNIAHLAGLQDSRAIFTASSAFNLAVDRLVSSHRVAEMPAQIRDRMDTTISALREKLGFRLDDAAVSTMITTRQIKEGAELLIVPPKGQDAFKVRIKKNAPAGMFVEPLGEIDPPIRVELVARYMDQEAVWEFDTEATDKDQHILLLKHTSQIRLVNRRRYARIPTNKPARLACLPFFQHSTEIGIPKFVAGTVVEIGGPGLVFEAPAVPKIGELIVVVVELEEGRIIQGVAKVHRVSTVNDELSNIAAQMIDLNESQTNALARATNLAETPAGQKKKEAPVASGAPQEG